jgi:23S rRNA pseudouridine1911/1915/1917 synthase
MEDNKYILTITEENQNIRLDVALTNFLKDHNLSRAKVQYLIKNNFVILQNTNTEILSTTFKTVLGQQFIIQLEQKESQEIIPKDIPLKILWEDDYFVVINKQKGLVVHAGVGTQNHTLVNALVYKYQNSLSSINNIRPGIVHRLDKDTSGVLVVAKTDEAHFKIAELFANHDIIRHYRALVWGKPTLNAGTVSTKINRNPRSPMKMMVSHSGRDAITNYKVIDSYENLLSLLDVKLQTGRTHQIRVHMQHLGHFVVGDQVYTANNTKYFNKLPIDIQAQIKEIFSQCLHAYRIGFVHPFTGEFVNIIEPEPDILLDLYKSLGFNMDIFKASID